MSLLNPGDNNKTSAKNSQIESLNKYRQEINNIYDKIDVNDLVFKGSVRVDVEVIENTLSISLESCSLEDKLSCFDPKEDKEINLDIQIKMLSKMLREIITEKGRREISVSGDEAIKMIKGMDASLVMKMITKMDQFMVALQRMVEGTGRLSIDDIIKK